MLRVFLLWPFLSGASVYFGFACIRFGEIAIGWGMVTSLWSVRGGRWVSWCTALGMALGLTVQVVHPVSFTVWVHQERALLPRVVRTDAAWATQVRAYGNRHFAELLPSREAALATGLLYGDAPFTHADKALIRNLGISHLTAVSGANLSFLLYLLSALWRRWIRSRGLRVWIEQLVILLLVIVTGAASSMVRAGVMALVSAWAPSVSRRALFRRSLLISVLCMGMVWPDVVLFDIGFQFSVAACLGLVMAGSVQEGRVSVFEGALRTGLWAWLWTIPIQLWVFHEWSWVGMFLGLFLAPYIEIVQVGLVILFVIPHPLIASLMTWSIGAIWRLLEVASRYVQPSQQWTSVTWVVIAYGVLTLLLIHRITKNWGLNTSKIVDRSVWKWMETMVLWGCLWSSFFDAMPDFSLTPFVFMLGSSARQTRYRGARENSARDDFAEGARAPSRGVRKRSTE